MDNFAIEGIETIVFRTVSDQMSIWEAVLPPELLKLPAFELIDAPIPLTIAA